MKKLLLTFVFSYFLILIGVCGVRTATEVDLSCNSSYIHYICSNDKTPPRYFNDTDNSSGKVVEGTFVNISTQWKDYLKDELLGCLKYANVSVYSKNVSFILQDDCHFNSNSGTCEYIFNTSLLELNDSVTVCWNQSAEDFCNNTNTTEEHCFEVVPMEKNNQENDSFESEETENIIETQPPKNDTAVSESPSEGETAGIPPAKTINHPPSTPSLAFPCENVSIPAGNITFVWASSTDEDPGDEENISYFFFLITSSQAGPNITSFKVMNPNKVNNTVNYTHFIPSPGHYSWGVKAFDGSAFSDEMALCQFNLVSVPSETKTTNLTEESSESIIGSQELNVSTSNISVIPWNQTSEKIIQIISTGIPETWIAGIVVGILVLIMLLFLYSHFYTRRVGEETAKKLLKKKETETRKKWIESLKARKKELNKKLAELVKKEIAGLTSDEIAAKKAYKQELIQIQETLLNMDEYLKELDARAEKALQEAKAGIPSKTIMKELTEEGYTKKEIEIIKRLFHKKLGK